MRKLYLGLFVAAAAVSIAIGACLFVRLLGGLFFRAGERPEPPEHAVRVTGHAAETLTAPRLGWDVELCADSRKLAVERGREAVRRGLKLLAAEDLVLRPLEPDDDHGQDVHTCVTVDVVTTRVADAIRWHRGLIAAGLVDAEAAADLECTGEGPLAEAKARTAMIAIKDARTQADTLLEGHGTAGRPGVEAEVTYDEGSWDARCERVVTAEVTLTVPTKQR